MFARDEVKHEHHICMKAEDSRSHSTGRNETMKTQLHSKARGVSYSKTCHSCYMGSKENLCVFVI